jgi:hypothetical protein
MMKTTIFLISSLIILSSLSCKKEYRDRPDVMPYFTALKNDTAWISSTSHTTLYTKNMKFVVSGGKRDSSYSDMHWLDFRFPLSDALQSENITKFYSQWEWVIGGDGIADRYIVDSLANNWIKISAIDTIAKMISGTFSIQLIREPSRHRPDTLRFTNGKFGVVYSAIPAYCN